MTVKRMNYFKGQFLKAEDFLSQQEYHQQMLQVHNRGLHTWGIVSGLRVKVEDWLTKEGVVEISRGSALDRDGNTIVLDEEGFLEISSWSGGPFYLVISYSEEKSDMREETGIKGYTRVTEKPLLKGQPTISPDKDIVLGKLTKDKKGKIEYDSSERRYGGVLFLSGEDGSPEIRGRMYKNKPGILLHSELTEVEGRLEVKNLRVKGTTILGEQEDEDAIIVNGIIHPRRKSNVPLPPNKKVGRKLQVTGDIEFQQMISTPGDMLISSAGDISFIAQKGVYIHRSKDPSKSNTGGNLVVEGDLTVLGTISTAESKQFAIKHPLNPADHLIHSSLEGPEAAVYYRGEASLCEGKATIEMPSYFEALTHPKERTVLLTPKLSDDSPVSALAASAVSDGCFMVKAIDDHNPSQDFYWEVKAVRGDIDALVVEGKPIKA